MRALLKDPRWTRIHTLQQEGGLPSRHHRIGVERFAYSTHSVSHGPAPSNHLGKHTGQDSPMSITKSGVLPVA